MQHDVEGSKATPNSTEGERFLKKTYTVKLKAKTGTGERTVKISGTSAQNAAYEAARQNPNFTVMDVQEG